MRKIIIRGLAKFAGTDFALGILVPDDTTDAQLDEYAWEAAVDNAEMYGEYLVDDYSEDDEAYEYEVTGDDLSYCWEDYDPEAHNMFRVGGGSFEDDFQ